jgi:hypothetical protein
MDVVTGARRAAAKVLRLARRALFLAAATALLEVGSEIALAKLRGQERGSYTTVKRDFVAGSLASHLAGGDGESSVGQWARAELRLHPMFGWVRSPGPKINTAGFLETASYPYRATEGELVIGLFGGSVAEQVCASAKQRLEQGLLQIVPERGFDRARVLCFAVAGHRQPQSLSTFLAYLDTIDVAVFLEGFNEVVFWSRPGYPLDLPNVGLWTPLVAQSAVGGTDAIVESLRSVAKVRKHLTEPFLWPPLRDSAAAHLGWSVLAAWERSREEGLRDELVQRATAQRFVDGDVTEAEMRERYLALYGSIVRWTAMIGRTSGVAVLHALQPNQYVEGSKPWSEEENARFRGDAAARAFVAAGYPRLQHALAEARSEGAGAIDLSDAFRGVAETLYVDSCCHLNERGTALVADALVRAIEASPELLAPLSDAKQRERGRWIRPSFAAR